jgi:hypothetical protein
MCVFFTLKSFLDQLVARARLFYRPAANGGAGVAILEAWE